MHSAKEKHEVHVTSYLEYCCEKRERERERERADNGGRGDASYVHLTIM
jgi:hypothetical protein